jgi:hypothetical protein
MFQKGSRRPNPGNARLIERLYVNTFVAVPETSLFRTVTISFTTNIPFRVLSHG